MLRTNTVPTNTLVFHVLVVIRRLRSVLPFEGNKSIRYVNACPDFGDSDFLTLVDYVFFVYVFFATRSDHFAPIWIRNCYYLGTRCVVKS